MENVYIPGSRIFLGNLASDHTSEREVRDMFLRYGNVKEVVIRKGFGFIQFDSPEAAQKAIAAENGKSFRGYKLDVSLATGESRKTTDKPRDASRTELPRPEPRPLPRPEPREYRERESRDRESRGRDLDRSRDSRERRDRKRSRSRDWHDDRATKRAHTSHSYSQHASQYDRPHYTRAHQPRSSAVQCDVLYDTPLLSSLAQDLCVEIERVVRTSAGTHLSTAWHHVPARELDAELRSHERHQVPYVCVLRESYSANIRDFRLRRKGDYFLDLFLLDLTGRYREHRDTEYEVVCDLIAGTEAAQHGAINSNTSNSAAPLLALLAQLQQAQSVTHTQPTASSTDLTALLSQLAPRLSPVTPVIGSTPLAVPTPVVPAQASPLQDLNSLVQQLIHSELHALAAPSSVPSTNTTGSSTDLLQSLLAAVNNSTSNTNVVNARPMQQLTPQLPQQFNHNTAAPNNSANLLSALQTLLNQSKPM